MEDVSSGSSWDGCSITTTDGRPGLLADLAGSAVPDPDLRVADLVVDSAVDPAGRAAEVPAEALVAEALVAASEAEAPVAAAVAAVSDKS